MRVLILLALVAATFADDECFQATKGYFECAKNAHDNHIEEKREIMEEIFNTIKTDCLEANGCDTTNLVMPGSDIHDHEGFLTEEQKTCLQKRIFEHKLQEVQDCTEQDELDTVFDALREVGRPEKVRFMETMRHAKMMMKKAIKKCQKENVDKRADISKCLMENKQKKKEIMDDACEKHQQCVDENFAEAPECLQVILDHKQASCDCFEEKIGKPAARFIGLVKRRKSWTADDRAEVVSRMGPHFEACDIDMDAMIEQMTAEEGRYRRHRRDVSSDNSGGIEGNSSEQEETGYARRKRDHHEGHGSSEEHGQGGKGGVHHGPMQMGENLGPLMCMCETKPIGEVSVDEEVDEVEGAVAAAFF